MLHQKPTVMTFKDVTFYSTCTTGSIVERRVLRLMQNEKQSDLYKHILYLCTEGNKEFGLRLNEYKRQWKGRGNRNTWNVNIASSRSI
jgi:hypothetical protein